MLKKIQALKPAPWWKRFIAYTIDQIFLFIILVIFVTGIYGNEFVELLDRINEIGGLKLFQENISSALLFQDISNLTPEQQNQLYWLQIIQTKYSKSIFLLSQILSSLYFAIFWIGTGQTIGAKMLNIRVVSYLGIQSPFVSMLIRVAVLKMIEMAWGLPALIVINPLSKQRLHDTLSQTIVVEDFDIDALLDDETDEISLASDIKYRKKDDNDKDNNNK